MKRDSLDNAIAIIDSDLAEIREALPPVDGEKPKRGRRKIGENS